ncbi:MAG: hypothetical protein WAU36_06390 [Cyclobacteriaceae bacterium]
MFGLFKSKTPKVSISDQVWLSQQSKWNACLKMAAANDQCIFVAWFSKTKDDLSQFLESNDVVSSVVLARDVTASERNGLYIFVEHYPLSEVEQALFLKLRLNKVPVLSSLDEHLFSMFGGEKTIRLMEKLGMEKDEIVSHPMITQSIRSAQRKIAKQVEVELKAESQQEWLSKNIK